MKYLILLLLALPTYFIAAQTEPAANDKDFLLDYYRETMDNLEKSISGLSEEQMQFNPSDSAWSVSQCVEHIILTENMIFEMLKGYMAQPANPERRKEIVYSDEEIIAFLTDRTEKYKAPEILQTKGKYNDPETALQDLERQRAQILEFIKNTELEEIRNRVNDSPAGATDAYQSLLFLAGHTARHTLQIQEVMADKNFPGK